MAEEITKPGYYAVIPASVRYDETLRPNGKLLYAEISALANKDGYCWADNKFFADNFGITEHCVQLLLKQLEKQGYLTIEVVQKGNQNQPEKRRIWLKDAAVRFVTKSPELVSAPSQKIRAPSQKIRATLNNNIINNNMDGACPDSVPKCSQGERFEAFWKLYKSVVPAGVPVGRKDRALTAWLKVSPGEDTIVAMESALKKQASGTAWLRGVGIPHLSTWLNGHRWIGEEETGTAGAEPVQQEAAIGWD